MIGHLAVASTGPVHIGHKKRADFQKDPKAQPAVILVLKRLRRRGHSLVSSNRLGEPGIELRTPGYKGSDLFTTPPRQYLGGSTVSLI